MTGELDIDAYFERIRYRGARLPTLEVLHALTAAHAQAIPFENIDVLLGAPIDLDGDALFRKLVVERRGGYCFEQNGLLLLVLVTLGFDVKPLSGRVRLQRPRDFTPARTHLFLRVECGGVPWLTDVGVGAASLTTAIRFDLEGEQPTAHEPRRILREDGRWFHQIRYGELWADVYEFTGEEMPFIDRVVGNWYTSTHPQSHFRDRLLVARALPDGRRVTVLNRELTHRERNGQATTRTIGSDEELRAILEESFGIVFRQGCTVLPV